MAQEDPEISAMAAISTALEPLSEEARRRVLGWAANRFGGDRLHSAAEKSGTKTLGPDPAAYENFAELFDAVGPKTDKERALAAAYWVQVHGSVASFPSQILNGNLKDLGQGVSNITDALDALRDEKPALVLQLRKDGTSRQARKTYRLTQEGIKRIKQMVSKEEI